MSMAQFLVCGAWPEEVLAKLLNHGHRNGQSLSIEPEVSKPYREKKRQENSKTSGSARRQQNPGR